MARLTLRRARRAARLLTQTLVAVASLAVTAAVLVWIVQEYRREPEVTSNIQLTYLGAVTGVLGLVPLVVQYAGAIRRTAAAG